jgi:hypothetical protein
LYNLIAWTIKTFEWQKKNVKTHRISPAPDNELDDIEIKDHVILPRGEDDRLPPRTLVMDGIMTHDRYGCTTQRTNGELSHRVSSTSAPQPDGTLNKAARINIRHYRQIYADRSVLAKDSAMRVTITIDLSTRSFIPLPRFFNSRRVSPLLNQSLVSIPQQSV